MTSLCSRQALFCGVAPSRRIRALESLFWLLAFCAACLVVGARGRSFTRRRCGGKRLRRLPVVLASLLCAERSIVSSASTVCARRVYAAKDWMTRCMPLYGGRRHKKLDRYGNESRRKCPMLVDSLCHVNCVVDVLNGDIRQELERPFLSTIEFWGIFCWPLRFLSALCFPSRHLC